MFFKQFSFKVTFCYKKHLGLSGTSRSGQKPVKQVLKNVKFF